MIWITFRVVEILPQEHLIYKRFFENFAPVQQSSLASQRTWKSFFRKVNPPSPVNWHNFCFWEGTIADNGCDIVRIVIVTELGFLLQRNQISWYFINILWSDRIVPCLVRLIGCLNFVSTPVQFCQIWSQMFPLLMCNSGKIVSTCCHRVKREIQWLELNFYIPVTLQWLLSLIFLNWIFKFMSRFSTLQ